MAAILRPSELATLLSFTIPAGDAVLVTGAPGIGKTSIVEQSADACGADVIVSHPAVSDPVDFKGMPWMFMDGDRPRATFLPFSEFERAQQAIKRTVWFFDDLGQAPPSVQAACMQLFLARRVGDRTVPDCVTFVAATNRRTDKAGVSGILEPVKSRFVSIVELTVSLDDWCAWAFAQNMPAELIAFLRFRPDLLSHFEATADLTNSPMPRTWSHVARLMAHTALPQNIAHNAIAGAVGEGAAVEFGAFRRLFAELPQIDGILLDPDASKLPTQPATLYAVATALGMKANKTNFGRVARYAERLTKANHGEFATLLLRDAVRRDASIMSTSSFVRLASGELGQLIAGAAS